MAKRQEAKQCKEKAKQAKELEKQKGAQAARAKKLEEKAKRTIVEETKASEKVLAIMEGKIRRVTKNQGHLRPSDGKFRIYIKHSSREETVRGPTRPYLRELGRPDGIKRFQKAGKCPITRAVWRAVARYSGR